MKSINLPLFVIGVAVMTLRPQSGISADVTGDRAIIGTLHETPAYWSSITGGYYNTNRGFHSIIGGGGYNTIHTNTETCVIGGGNLNQISSNCIHAAISGGYANVLGPDCDASVICGGSGNRIGHDSYGSGISGGVICVIGEDSAYAWIGGGSWNVIEDDCAWASVCGGYTNCLARGSSYSAILGGLVNTIEGSNTEANANVIGGGQENRIQTNSTVCFIGAGIVNKIETNASRCAIICGGENRISKDAFGATVVNGHSNRAGGTNSLAGGYRAKATHNGSYVWADYNEADLSTTAANQYLVRAAGGVKMYTDSGATTGAQLASGSGSWSSVSDRNAKENVQPTNAREILEKLAALPISTWNYKAQDDNVRHIGPMAQDFRQAFALGEDERYITAVDADGVALAAIQGLYEMLREKDTQLKELQKELKAIKDQLLK